MSLPEDPLLCSYSGDPANGGRDEIRFWVQDTDPDFWFLTDAEVDYLIDHVSDTTNSDPVWIASVVALSIAAKCTREVSVTADGISVDVGSLQRRYIDLAQQLRDQYVETHGDLELPTLVISTHQPDPSIPPLLFGIGKDDNFEAGRQDYGNRRLPTDPATAPSDPLEQW